MTTAVRELQRRVTVFFTRCVQTGLLTHLTYLQLATVILAAPFVCFLTVMCKIKIVNIVTSIKVYILYKDCRRSKIFHWSKLRVRVRATDDLGWDDIGDGCEQPLPCFIESWTNFTYCFCGFLILISFFKTSELNCMTVHHKPTNYNDNSEPWCHCQNVHLYHYRLNRLVVTLTLTCDLENPFSNAHSHDEYLWQVSFKFIHQVNRYRITRNR